MGYILYLCGLAQKCKNILTPTISCLHMYYWHLLFYHNIGVKHAIHESVSSIHVYVYGRECKDTP